MTTFYIAIESNRIIAHGDQPHDDVQISPVDSIEKFSNRKARDARLVEIAKNGLEQIVDAVAI